MVVLPYLLAKDKKKKVDGNIKGRGSELWVEEKVCMDFLAIYKEERKKTDSINQTNLLT